MIVDWQKLNTLRAAAKDERDPTTPDDVLAVLCQETERMQNARILEVGTGRGLTSAACDDDRTGGNAHSCGERDVQRVRSFRLCDAS